MCRNLFLLFFHKSSIDRYQLVSSQEDTRPKARSREFIRRASLALIVGALSISTIPAFSQDQSAAPVAAPVSPIGISQPTAQDMAMLQGTYPPDNAIWLESLDLHNMTMAWGEPRIGKSLDWKPLTLKGTVYPHGIGAQTRSQMTVDLKGVATRFMAMVGVDDDTNGKGNIDVTILVDGKKVVDTGPMQGGEAPRFISIDLTDARRMVLDANGVDNKNDSGHVDWAGAMILLDPDEKDRPESVNFSTSAVAYKLPPAPPVDPRPAIHGPLVMGASPNRPFVFLVPVTGKGPFTYSAAALPKGLKLDAKMGVILGAVSAAGTYDIRVTVKGPAGTATKTFGLICGDHKLALTPPLAWNAWNVYGDTVTAEKIKDQVDWLVKTGLAGHGFQYIIIDDSWEGRRDAEGNIGPNKRFGDIKSLADYVHSKGLRLGIYSSPNEETCSGYAGSAGHEEKDAAFYASCGIDYLKYDWCEAGGSKKDTTADVMKAAYNRMRSALDKVNRDILYDLTPYGFGKVWEWGADVGANSWQTSTQVSDKWESIQNAGFDQGDRAKYAGPGHWNNPGYLMLGRMNPTTPRFPRLRPNEQMTQVTLWSLLAAPLILSCDMSQLDPNNFFPITSMLLSNDEVIAIDQDPLGHVATRRAGWGDWEVWTRPLLDGTIAAGVFNKTTRNQEITFKLGDLGLNGPQLVRDVWQHKDLGSFKDTFSATVPPHGAMLLKIGTPLSPSNQVNSWTKPVYMVSNWTWGDGLHWAYSRNGSEWLQFPRDKVWLKPEIGDKNMQNTNILRGPDGLWHMVWSVGGNAQGFGYATSQDALTWSDQRIITPTGGDLAGGMKNVRFPKLFYDKKSGQYVISFSAIVQDEGKSKMWGYRIYAVTTKDFQHFSEPKRLLTSEHGTSDGTIAEAGGQYFLIFRDEDKHLIRVTTAINLEGPYNTQSEPLPIGKDVEDPTLVRMNNQYYVYFTRHVGQQTTGVARSKDLKNWEDVSAQMSFPKDHRYGSIVTIPETTLQDILRSSYER